MNKDLTKKDQKVEAYDDSCRGVGEAIELLNEIRGCHHRSCGCVELDENCYITFRNLEVIEKFLRKIRKDDNDREA